MSETIADILREMRERADAMQIHGTVLGVKRTVKEFADRIEAAHDREMADALDTGAFVAAARQTDATAPVRNCEKCRTADDAMQLAIDAGVVDCGFGAREMAEFLLAEVVVSKSETTTDIEEVIADLRESGAK